MNNAKPIHRLRQTYLLLTLILLSFSAMAQIAPDENNIVYVKKGAIGNGSSWENAIGELADALKWAKAEESDWTAEAPLRIYVAKGVYHPLYSPADGFNVGPRNNSFLLVRDVQLYGGFDPDAGITNLSHHRVIPSVVEGSPLHGTILSGDLDNSGTLNDNDAYHVVLSLNNVGAALLDGFTITGGNANGVDRIIVNGIAYFYQERGGGVYTQFSSPVLRNVTISGNKADDSYGEGGGMYAQYSSPVLTNVTISGNTARDGGGMYNNNTNLSKPALTNVTISDNTAARFGGGMYNNGYAPVLTDVTISDNTANGHGGGMYNNNHNINTGSPVLRNVTISGNTANNNSYGGGIYNTRSSLALTNATISGNRASFGGGIFNDLNSSPKLTNVTISGNWASQGGAMSNYDNSSPTLYNSIVWGNSSGVVNVNNSNPTYSHSLVQGVINTSNGNVSSAGIPTNGSTIFAAPVANGAAPTTAGDYRLREHRNNPAINSGNNALLPDLDEHSVDLAGNPRLFGGTIDLGGYEVQTILIRPNTDNILYVKQGGTGDGSSWDNAVGELADALKWAKAEESDWTEQAPLQIYVATGIYKPMYSPADDKFGQDDGRNNAFLMVKNVQLYGGFDPDGGIRDLSHHRVIPSGVEGSPRRGTILSGDLDNSGTLNNNDAYHVVLSVGDVGTARLDGFTISGGNANGNAPVTVNSVSNILQSNGGGMYNDSNSSPALMNVTISGNTAIGGGGIVNANSSSPALTNVAISGNMVDRVYGSGGGMLNANFSSPTLTNVTISGNTAAHNSGGGIYNNISSSPKLYNSIVWGNSNGVVNVNNSSPTYSHSLVQGREVTDDGNISSADIPPDGSTIFEAPVAHGTEPTTAGDYRLRGVRNNPIINRGSNQLYWDAVGKGAPLPLLEEAAWGIDLAGNPRLFGGKIDLGAYEVQAIFITPDADNILYVQQGGIGDGSSWDNAVGELADALKWAKAEESKWTAEAPLRIYVGKGVYHPLYSPADNNFGNPDGRNNSFLLVRNVQLYGGFDPDAGISDLSHHRVIPSVVEGSPQDGTVLSGDLDNSEPPDNDAYRVVLSVGDVGTALLDGFTITGGNANSLTTITVNSVSSIYQNLGGGMLNYSSSPILTNVTISGNSAGNNGGGMYNWEYASPVLMNVTISGNSANGGGGMYNWTSSSPTLMNVAISGNRSSTHGGGMYNDGNSSPTLMNVTISGNTANNGGGMYNIFNASPRLDNSIVWGNSSGVVNNSESNPTYSHSLVQGREVTDDGNISSADIPTDGSTIFEAPVAHGTAPTTAGDYRLQRGSPAINAGNNAANTSVQDIAGNVRVQGGRIDIGAYESAYQNMVSIENPETITVPFGTALADVPLPDGFSVSATLSDGSEEAVQLDAARRNWQLLAPQVAFDPNIAGTYTFSVPVIPKSTSDPAWFTNSSNLTTELAITIEKGTPVITWVDPANIVYGTALGEDQLNAVADVSGTFVYTLAVGTVLPAGTHTLSVTFTPTDTDNYETATAMAQLVIKKAPITNLTFTNVVFSYDGTAKSIFVLGAAPIGTTITYTGNDQIAAGDYTVTAEIDGGTNYEDRTLTAQLRITQITIAGVAEGEHYNTDRVISFNDGTNANNPTALLNNSVLFSGDKVSSEGRYLLVVTDAGGTSTEVNFTIDKTPPVVNFVLVPGNFKYGKGDELYFVVSFSESLKVVQTQGKPRLAIGIGGQTVYAEYVPHANDYQMHFIYTVAAGLEDHGGIAVASEVSANGATITDLAGNEADLTLIGVGNTDKIIVDSKPPTATMLINGGATHTNSEYVTLSFDNASPDTHFLYLANDEHVQVTDEDKRPFTSVLWTLIGGEGLNTVYFTVADELGNMMGKDDHGTVVPGRTTIILDQTPPVVTGVSDGGHYNTDRTIGFNEGTAILNGEVFSNISTVYLEGSHTLVVTDEAGNSTTINFVIDKTPPEVSGVSNDGIYNNDRTITFNEGTAILNGDSFASGTVVSAEGSYDLVVTDAAENSTTVKFVIDKTAPQVVALDVPNPGIYLEGEWMRFFVHFSEPVQLDGTQGRPRLAVEIAGKWVYAEYQPIMNSVAYVFEFAYRIEAGLEDYDGIKIAAALESNGASIKDAAGNEAILTLSGLVIPTGIFVDSKPPVVHMEINGGAAYTNDRNVTVSLMTDDTDIDYIVFAHNEDGDGVTDLEPFAPTKTWELTAGDGAKKVLIVVFDKAGNPNILFDEDGEPIFTYATIILDQTPPVLTGVSDGERYNTDRTVCFNEGSATLNGESFSNNTVVAGDGDYMLVVTDAAGNSTTVNFVIDKTAPTTPSNLTATPNSGYIDLRWDANAEQDLMEYRIYTGTTADQFGLLTNVAAGTENYSHGPLTSGQQYYYTITAVDELGNESPRSAVVEAMPQDVQTISFDALADRIYGQAPFALTAIASSGLPVTYNSSNPAIASVEGDILTIHSAGQVTITASQAGNAAYLPAAPVAQQLTIEKATVTGIAFEDASFTYDGTAKSLAISGTLPENTLVSYIGNAQTEVGIYTVTASIEGGQNHNDWTQKATLTIGKADITGITFDDGSFVYDGTEKSITISGTLPAGAIVSYENNARTKAGTQTVTANISGGNNYSDWTETATLTIGKADITGITFDNGSFVYDGTEKSITISGTLPDGATVSYTNNGRTEAGTQTVTANIDGGDNHNSFSLTAQLEITKANISDISFDDGSFVYDGTAKSFVVSGVPPRGTIIDYTINGQPGNSATNAGSYEVTATITGGQNYSDWTETAELEIIPAILTVTADSHTKLFGSPDPAFGYAVQGIVTGDAEEDILSGAITRTTGESIGDYTITQGTLTAQDNYQLVFHPGTLSIYHGIALSPIDPVIISEKQEQTVQLHLRNTWVSAYGAQETILLNLTEGQGFTIERMDSDSFDITRQNGRWLLRPLSTWENGEQRTLTVTLVGDGRFVGNSYLDIEAWNPLNATSSGDLRYNIAVEIRDGDYEIAAQNVFTPNGDGINDTFVFPGLQMHDRAEFTVLNRFGDQVYHNPDYKNDWTAHHVQDGTYYYVLQVWRYDHIQQKTVRSFFRGSVLVKRN